MNPEEIKDQTAKTTKKIVYQTVLTILACITSSSQHCGNREWANSLNSSSSPERENSWNDEKWRRYWKRKNDYRFVHMSRPYLNRKIWIPLQWVVIEWSQRVSTTKEEKIEAEFEVHHHYVSLIGSRTLLILSYPDFFCRSLNNQRMVRLFFPTGHWEV